MSLRDLPDDMTAGNILNAQRDKIDKNLYSPREQKTYVELQAGGGYFSKFDWKPEPYDSFLTQQREENHNKKQTV